MNLHVQIKSVYGTDKVYPVNTPAQLFARIAGTKTLTRETLRNVFALGCVVSVLDRYGQIAATFNRQNPAHVELLRVAN
jgi:hypothetical protein